MSQGYRELRVWQAGMTMAEQVYRLTSDWPRHELYVLGQQVRRAAVSVPSNIAEGSLRDSIKEFLYFVSVAHGSLAELQTQLELAGRLEYLSADQTDEILDDAAALSRQLHKFRKALTQKE